MNMSRTKPRMRLDALPAPTVAKFFRRDMALRGRGVVGWAKAPKAPRPRVTEPASSSFEVAWAWRYAPLPTLQSVYSCRLPAPRRPRLGRLAVEGDREA